MQKPFSLILTFLLVTRIATAQVEVPVSYDLGVKGGEKVVGYITGGSIFEPEGMNITPDQGTFSSLLKYIEIDQISGLSIKEGNLLSMNVMLKSGKKFAGTAKITDSEPILILRDEAASGVSSAPGKERMFTKTGFRGIPLIEFEAAVSPEANFEAVKELSKRFQAAVEEQNIEKMVDFHNQIGELLENFPSDADNPGNASESLSTDGLPK